jgi:hypothetical protein
VTVEDGREDAGAVHLRQRQPLDVPARRHEGTHLAVGEQAVVGDRWKGTAAERDLTLEAFADRELKLHAATVLEPLRSTETPCRRYTSALLLKRLGVEAIALYQIHWPGDDENIEEGWSAFAELKEQELVRHIGVSNFDVEHLRRVQ